MPVLSPSTLAEALRLLTGESGKPAIPLAGGTDLLVHWPVRLEAHGHTYLDLWRLTGELRGLRWTEEALELGALTTYWDVITNERVAAEFPLLVTAARQVGAIQIQSRGTWAGNIVNASPAADGVPVLMAYDAIVLLTSISGRREVPLSEFYLGYRETVRRPDELVTAIRLPRRRYDFQEFVKVGPRRAQAIAKVGLAAVRSGQRWRVVAASVAPVVTRCPAVEGRLADGPPIDRWDALLPALREDVSPIDDLRSSAEYRTRVLAQLLWHVAREGEAPVGRRHAEE